jgi:hypothetical protein
MDSGITLNRIFAYNALQFPLPPLTNQQVLLKTSHSQQLLKKITVSLICLGFLAGFLVGYGVLAGDAQGRVNLLYVLMLFAFLPVLTLLLSLLLWLSGSGKGLVNGLFELPILPRQYAAEVVALAGSGSRKAWLFYQTQCLTLSFAGGGVLVYLLLLLGSDISFVWRSTLLEATDLLPLLNTLALPWLFWPEAQPGLELLQQTQDFRLSAQSTDAPVLGQWWKFILAAQCAYNLLPRTLMLLLTRYRYLQQAANDARQTTNGQTSTRLNTARDDRSLVPIVYSIATPYVLLNWANAPAICQQSVAGRLGAPVNTLAVDPLAVPGKGELLSHTLVVLVKSWEPPLAELGDYLLALPASGSGSGAAQRYLLPLDWTEQRLVPTRANHLDEWRRFCSTLPGWQLLQLEAST